MEERLCFRGDDADVREQVCPGHARFFGASAQPFVLTLAESAALSVALFLWRKVRRGP